MRRQVDLFFAENCQYAFHFCLVQPIAVKQSFAFEPSRQDMATLSLLSQITGRGLYRSEPDVKTWLKNRNNRKKPGINLFRADFSHQISAASVYIHLNFLKKQVESEKDQKRKSELKKMYKDEMRRVVKIFQTRKKNLSEDVQRI